jgi:retinol dehydrogenase 12
MQQKVCLITGATEGVGRCTALELARKGLTVVLAARNAAKAHTVQREIVAATGNRNVDFIDADLRSLAQIRALAQTFKQRYPRLDVLVNNAGIFAPTRLVTADGYESTYQVNYLAQFYLTQLLLDALADSGAGRIVNLCSSVYASGRFDPDNLQGERRFSTFAAYAASKLLVLLFTVELAQRLEGTGVTANAVHPGVVRTQMILSAPGMLRLVAYLALPFALSPEKGAATSVYVATSPEVQAVSGRYFTRSRVAQFETAFDTQANRALLWDLTLRDLARAS